MEFIKNHLIDKALVKYYETFSRTLDTCDYVPTKYNDKISKYIFKNMKKKFSQIDVFYLLILESMGVKLGFWSKLKVSVSGLRGQFECIKDELLEELEKLKLEDKLDISEVDMYRLFSEFLKFVETAKQKEQSQGDDLIKEN